MSAYSRIGLTKEKYMVCNDFLSNWNFKVCNMLSRFQAFDVISEICSCQVKLLLNTSPKCLWNSTRFTSTVSIETVGWFICTFFLEIISSSVLFMKVHVMHQKCISPVNPHKLALPSKFFFHSRGKYYQLRLSWSLIEQILLYLGWSRGNSTETE